MHNQPQATKQQPTKFVGICFTGLASIAHNWIISLKGEVLNNYSVKNYEVIEFTLSNQDYKALFSVLVFEDIFIKKQFIESFTRTGDIKKISRFNDSQIDLINRIKSFNKYSKLSRTRSFFCFVKQDQDKLLHRKRIADIVIDNFKSSHPRFRISDPAYIESWIFLVKDSLLDTIRLTDEGYRYRLELPSQRQAALRPSIAAAMVFTAGIKDGETVCDPMCGSGTILKESQIRFGNSIQLKGYDIDKEAIEESQTRMAGSNAQIQQDDSRHLDLPDYSVDKIICNLPFGKIYSIDTNLTELYTELFKCWSMKLRQNGSMVVLTSAKTEVATAASNCNLLIKKIAIAAVLGLNAEIYLLQRDE